MLPSHETEGKLLCQEIVPLPSLPDDEQQPSETIENHPEETQTLKPNALSAKAKRRAERLAYESLREVIPSLAVRQFRKNKITKLETVREAVRYIKQLENTLESMERMNALITKTESQK